MEKIKTESLFVRLIKIHLVFALSLVAVVIIFQVFSQQRSTERNLKGYGLLATNMLRLSCVDRVVNTLAYDRIRALVRHLYQDGRDIAYIYIHDQTGALVASCGQKNPVNLKDEEVAVLLNLPKSEILERKAGEASYEFASLLSVGDDLLGVVRVGMTDKNSRLELFREITSFTGIALLSVLLSCVFYLFFTKTRVFLPLKNASEMMNDFAKTEPNTLLGRIEKFNLSLPQDEVGAMSRAFEQMIITIISSDKKRRQAEEALQKAHDVLEKRVEERSAELTKANEELRTEIIERKQAEQALLHSEAVQRAILDGITTNIRFVNQDLGIIWVNKAGAASVNRSPQEMIGHKCYEFWGDDPKKPCKDCPATTILREKKTKQVISHSRDGKIWELKTEPVFDDKRKLMGIVELAHDITDKSRLEAQLQQAQKMESIGTLAGGIAHDFNNLLYVIMGNISMVKDDVKPEYGVTDFLNAAEEASLKAKELANQLITFSEGGAPVKKVSSIGNSVKETTNLILSDSNVKSEFIFPDDLWPVEFDEGQMKHAVKNIIDNAVESMPDDGAIVVKAENFKISSGTIEKSSPLSKEKYVKISIRDHGVGIPEERFSKIFDPYFSTKERGIEKGMGLGLATTYSIINRHDGHITVESGVGVGTTFTIYLPAAVEEIVDTKPAKMVEPEKPAVRTGRILVMDDEEMIRNFLTHVLIRLDYEPELARDGAETIELYKRAMDSGKPFDTVILDLTVNAGKGGKETVKKLLEINPQARAIISSGYSNDPVITDFRKYGFIGALAKPYTMKDLDDTLNKVLGKS